MYKPREGDLVMVRNMYFKEHHLSHSRQPNTIFKVGSTVADGTVYALYYNNKTFFASIEELIPVFET